MALCKSVYYYYIIIIKFNTIQLIFSQEHLQSICGAQERRSCVFPLTLTAVKYDFLTLILVIFQLLFVSLNFLDWWHTLQGHSWYEYTTAD